jgi:hypothetical protein
MAGFAEGDGEAGVGQDIVRGDGMGGAEGGDFLFEAVLFVVDAREVDMEDVVVLGDGDAVQEEGFGAAPQREVGAGEQEAGHKGGGGQDGEQRAAARAGDEFQRRPDQQDGEADAGEVGEAVGDGGDAETQAADNGEDRNEEPEPADEEGRATVAKPEGGDGDGAEAKEGNEGEPRDGHIVFGIDDGEGVGPEELDDIGPEVGGDEGEAGGGGDVVGGAAAAGVGVKIDDGENAGEKNQAPFFGNEAAPGGPLAAVEGVAGAAQRPVVEQEQDGRQDDEDALGEEAEKHEGGEEPAAGGGWAFDEAQVGQEREHEEESAQDVLAGGDPGDGLDVLGVDGEEGGDEGGGPEGFCQAGENPEQEGGVEGVQENVREVVAEGAGAEEFRIEHEGNPQEGQPPLLLDVGEGPAEIFEGKPRQNRGVFIDVMGVVEVDEIEAGGGPEEGEGEGGEAQGDEEPQAQGDGGIRAGGLGFCAAH